MDGLARFAVCMRARQLGLPLPSQYAEFVDVGDDVAQITSADGGPAPGSRSDDWYHEGLPSLRLLQDADYRWLEAAFKRRQMASFPLDPVAFREHIERDSVALYVAEDRGTPRPLLIASLGGLDVRNRKALVRLVTLDDEIGWGFHAFGAFAQLLKMILNDVPLRKVYLELSAAEASSMASGVPHWLTFEGQLRDHAYHNGNFEDLFVIAITAGQASRWIDLIESGDSALRESGSR
jgi:hypothetical protein